MYETTFPMPLIEEAVVIALPAAAPGGTTVLAGSPWLLTLISNPTQRVRNRREPHFLETIKVDADHQQRIEIADIVKLFDANAVPHLVGMQLFAILGRIASPAVGSSFLAATRLEVHLASMAKDGEIPAWLPCGATKIRYKLDQLADFLFSAVPPSVWDEPVAAGSHFSELSADKQSTRWSQFGVQAFSIVVRYLAFTRHDPFNHQRPAA